MGSEFTVTCDYCGKPVARTQRSAGKHVFCDRTCSNNYYKRVNAQIYGGERSNEIVDVAKRIARMAYDGHLSAESITSLLGLIARIADIEYAAMRRSKHDRDAKAAQSMET